MTVILEAISLFVISVDLVVATETCGAVQANEVEISAGWTKFTHKQPWLVKIFARYINSKKKLYTVECLGTAITEKWVLTVAVCVEKAEQYD